MTRPEVGLLVADPYSFLSSYPVMLGEAEQKLLKLEKSEDSAILVTVSIPAGRPRGRCPQSYRANCHQLQGSPGPAGSPGL